MQYRPLGDTGLLVSERGFGAGSLQRLDDEGHKDAQRKISIALDHGVNLFDTADAYSDGRSEQLLGEALGTRRDDVLIATKVRSRTHTGPNGAGLTRSHIIRSLEASLRRLGTDYVDLYQLHMWDGLTPLEETLAALQDLIRDGKVRHVGVSNFSAWHLMRAVGITWRDRLSPIASQQIHYTPFTRDVELELLPATVSEHIGVLVWSPLGGGLLGGHIRSADAHSAKVSAWREPPVDDPARLESVLSALEAVATRNRTSVANVTIAWTLSNPAISSVLLGGRTPEQLEQNLIEAPVAADDLELIERRTRRHLPYPYWHQAATITDRLSPADRALHGPRMVPPNLTA